MCVNCIINWSSHILSSKQTKHSPHQLPGASHYPIVFMNLFSSVKSVSLSAFKKTASGRTRSSIVWLVFGTVLFSPVCSLYQPSSTLAQCCFTLSFQTHVHHSSPTVACAPPPHQPHPPHPTCAPHLPDYIVTLYRCVLCRKPEGPAVYHGTSSCAVVIVCCVLILWCVVCRKHVQHPGPALDHGLPPLQPPHGVRAAHQHHADQVWSLR